MKQKTEQELADGIIKMLEDAGYTYYDILPVITLVSEKFYKLKSKEQIEHAHKLMSEMEEMRKLIDELNL